MFDARDQGSTVYTPKYLPCWGCWVNDFCHITITPYDLYFRNMTTIFTSISWCFTGSLERSKPQLADDWKGGFRCLTNRDEVERFQCVCPKGNMKGLEPRPQLTAGRLKTSKGNFDAVLVYTRSAAQGKLCREFSGRFVGSALQWFGETSQVDPK